MTMKSDSVDMSRFQTPGRTKLIKGSVLSPETAGLRLVLSVTNLAGKPDNNPLYPLFEKKWKKVREEARGWYVNKTGKYTCGAVMTTAVQSDVWVLSLLAQDDKFNTDVAGLQTCLKEVYKVAKAEQASVHVSTLLTDYMPEMTELLKNELVARGVSVYFYEETAR